MRIRAPCWRLMAPSWRLMAPCCRLSPAVAVGDSPVAQPHLHGVLPLDVAVAAAGAPASAATSGSRHMQLQLRAAAIGTQCAKRVPGDQCRSCRRHLSSRLYSFQSCVRVVFAISHEGVWSEAAGVRGELQLAPRTRHRLPNGLFRCPSKKSLLLTPPCILCVRVSRHTQLHR